MEMATLMMAPGSLIITKERVFSNGEMVISMMVRSTKVNEAEKGLSLGLMEILILDLLKKTGEMAKEN